MKIGEIFQFYLESLKLVTFGLKSLSNVGFV